MDRGSGYQQRWFDTPETLNEKETCSKSYWLVSNFSTKKTKTYRSRPTTSFFVV